MPSKTLLRAAIVSLPRNQEAMHNAWLRWHALQARCLSWTPAETDADHFLWCIFLRSLQVMCQTATLGASNVSLLKKNLFLNSALSVSLICAPFCFNWRWRWCRILVPRQKMPSSVLLQSLLTVFPPSVSVMFWNTCKLLLLTITPF